MHTFLPSSCTDREQRLVSLHTPAAAPHAEAKKEGADKPKADAAKATVDAHATDTKNAVHAATGGHIDHTLPAGHDYQRPSFLEYKSLPTLGREGSSHWKTLRRAALTAGVIANPVAALAVGAPVYTGLKLWGKAKEYPPFSWARAAGGAVHHTVMDAGRSVWDTVTYPARLAGTAALNVGVRAPLRAAHYTYERLFVDLLDDAKVVLKQKLNIKDTKGEEVSLPALIMTAAKKGVGQTLAAAGRGIIKYMDLWHAHPYVAGIGTLIAVGALATPGGMTALASLSYETFTALLKFISSKVAI